MNEERKSKLLALRNKRKERLQSEIKELIPEPIPGEDGIDGETPNDDHLVELITPLIPEPIKGEDGKTPTEAQIKKLLMPLIPEPIPGKKGKDGKNGKDGSAPVWRKSWKPGVNYVINDVVEHDGSSFICIKDHKSRNVNEPDLGTEWPMIWGVVARRGLKGADGVSYSGGGSGSGGGAVSSVNGKVGVVVLDKSDVGLGNVDNTSDANKPVSTAQQTALDGKVDENVAITGATKTKITYDAKGLVTAGADATTSDISEGSNLYFTNERVDDRVDALIQDSSSSSPGITWSYNDGAGTLTPTITVPFSYFIYNSSGSQTYPAGNRFNDWADLVAVLQVLEGAKTIQFEQSESLPSGAYNMANVTLKGNGSEYTAGGYTVTCGTGVTFTSMLNFTLDSINLKSTSSSPIFDTSSTFNIRITTVSHLQSTTAEFIRCSGAGQSIIAFQNSGRMDNEGYEAVSFTGGAFAQTVVLSFGDNTVIEDDSIRSTNGQILIQVLGTVVGDANNFPTTHTNFTVGFGLDLKLAFASNADFRDQSYDLGTTTGVKIGTSTTQKLGFFNATPVTQPTELTDELTSITHTAPGTPDYAIQDLTQTTPFGFATKDEGNTVLSVILNLQTRVNELETKLNSLGLLADAD